MHFCNLKEARHTVVKVFGAYDTCVKEERLETRPVSRRRRALFLLRGTPLLLLLLLLRRRVPPLHRPRVNVLRLLGVGELGVAIRVPPISIRYAARGKLRLRGCAAGPRRANSL